MYVSSVRISTSTRLLLPLSVRLESPALQSSASGNLRDPVFAPGSLGLTRNMDPKKRMIFDGVDIPQRRDPVKEEPKEATIPPSDESWAMTSFSWAWELWWVRVKHLP